MPVTEAANWGLPPHMKQKVVWLCAKCAQTKEVRFDDKHCQVLIVSRLKQHQRIA